MPYTLMKFLVWAIAFFGIGVLVGWLLRALKARSEVAAARRSTSAGGVVAAGSAVVDDQVAAPDAAGDDRGDDGEPSEPATSAGDHRGGSGDEPHDHGIEREAETSPMLDLEEARAVLGAPIELDDLTVVDGVGPKIAELCAGIGITTWRALADADPVTLREMLDDAGSRFRIHDPATWSRQAELLADGRWSEFVAYDDEMNDGS